MDQNKASDVSVIGDFKGTWDGHTTAQKFERLHALLNRPEESAGGST